MNKHFLYNDIRTIFVNLRLPPLLLFSFDTRACDMAAREEYWCDGDPKQFMASLPKELRFNSLAHPDPNYPKNLRDILHQKRLRRARTLDGVVCVSATIAYSFHTVVVINKSKTRGTATPTSIHLIMKHTPWTEIVFYAEGYASHHNYFSANWTSDMFAANDLQILATIKKSGEQIKLFRFHENSELREHLGPYLVGSKGSFNQQSPYVQKAVTRLRKDHENLVTFLDKHEVETMFLEMMIGDQHVFPNPPDTPAFYVHAIRAQGGVRIPNNAPHSCVSNDVLQEVPVVGTYRNWSAFLEAYGRLKGDPMYSMEEGLYAHESSTGTAIKFKFPRYLAFREMRQSRFGPMHTLDTAYAYLDAMVPDMSTKLSDLVSDYPAVRNLDVTQEQKIDYARLIREWNLHWANLKTFEPGRAEKILAGDFICELTDFATNVCSTVSDPQDLSRCEQKLLVGLANSRPVVYLLMLTGPPGSGKSTQVSTMLMQNYGPDSFVWFTQDLLGTRANLVDNVVDFAKWTSEREPGAYVVVVDRCNPDRRSRQRLFEDIRMKLGTAKFAPTAEPIIWTQHCALLISKDPLETLTLRVMMREHHPSLTPDFGIISVAEIIDEHFLKSSEPPLNSIDIFRVNDVGASQLAIFGIAGDDFVPNGVVRSIKDYQRIQLAKNTVTKKKKRHITYAGIVVFDELGRLAPIDDPVLEQFEIRKTVLHTTLHYFGKNPVVTLGQNSDDPVDKRICDLCFGGKLNNVTGRLLGHYIDPDLGVAGYLVRWDPLIEVGDTKVHHITTHLKNKSVNPFDSNKVLVRAAPDDTAISLSVDDIGGWDNHGKITWYRAVVPLTRSYAGFATSA